VLFGSFISYNVFSVNSPCYSPTKKEPQFVLCEHATASDSNKDNNKDNNKDEKCQSQSQSLCWAKYSFEKDLKDNPDQMCRKVTNSYAKGVRVSSERCEQLKREVNSCKCTFPS